MMWSPPDKTFSIKVPAELKEEKGAYTDGVADNDASLYKAISVFGGTTKSDQAFLVVTLKLTEKAKRLNTEKKLGGLEFLIGGDDATPTDDKLIQLGNLRAREVLYSSDEGCSKGLMIDADRQIVVMGLASSSCKYLKSDVAKHFFSSFRLL